MSLGSGFCEAVLRMIERDLERQGHDRAIPVRHVTSWRQEARGTGPCHEGQCAIAVIRVAYEGADGWQREWEYKGDFTDLLGELLADGAPGTDDEEFEFDYDG